MRAVSCLNKVVGLLALGFVSKKNKPFFTCLITYKRTPISINQTVRLLEFLTEFQYYITWAVFYALGLVSKKNLR